MGERQRCRRQIAALRSQPGRGQTLQPLILSLQALIATVAALGLRWAAWRQLKRGTLAPTPWRNSAQAFGLVSRHGHWATKVRVLCSIPMGLFINVLPPQSPQRAGFLSVHQGLGLVVLLVVLLRLLWLLGSPVPAPALTHARATARTGASARVQATLARAAHGLLDGAIALMSVSGLWMVFARGEALPVLGLQLAAPALADTTWSARLVDWHGAVLPLLLMGLIALHRAAVLKHHVLDGQRAAVRRMLGSGQDASRVHSNGGSKQRKSPGWRGFPDGRWGQWHGG